MAPISCDRGGILANLQPKARTKQEQDGTTNAHKEKDVELPLLQHVIALLWGC